MLFLNHFNLLTAREGHFVLRAFSVGGAVLFGSRRAHYERSTIRIRRTYLHLSYSYASPFGPALLVTQNPSRDTALAQEITRRPMKRKNCAGGHIFPCRETVRFREIATTCADPISRSDGDLVIVRECDMTWKILIIVFAVATCHATAAFGQPRNNIMKTKHDTVKNSISNIRSSSGFTRIPSVGDGSSGLWLLSNGQRTQVGRVPQGYTVKNDRCC
jgi:hypothetical protein